MVFYNRKINLSKVAAFGHGGRYFVAVGARGAPNLFGRIRKGRMVLNGNGRAVRETLTGFSENFQNCRLEDFVILPGYFLLIIVFESRIKKGCAGNGLSGMIRRLKAVAAGKMKKAGPASDFGWQRSFFARPIDDRNSYQGIRKFIFYNRLVWHQERD